MKKSAILLVSILLLISLVGAQAYKGKARVKGIVLDEQGHPIEGVHVKLYLPKAEGGVRATTDSKGIWKANWIRFGSWSVDFEKLGYEPKKISIQVSEAKKNPLVDVVLIKAKGLVISEDIKSRLDKGNALFDQGKYDEAIALFQTMVEENPDLYVIYTNIGNCYFQQNKYDEAITSYQKVLEQDPENVSAMLSIGNSLANAGDNEKAMAWYKKINMEKITDVTVLYNIGTALYNKSEFKEALRYYQRAVDLKEDFLDGLYQLGLANLTLGNKEEAISSFNKYLEKDSESARAEQVKGFLSYLKKRPA